MEKYNSLRMDERPQMFSIGKRDDSGVYMQYDPATPIPDVWRRFALEISLLRGGLKPLYVMVNALPSGVLVPVHTDTLEKKVERWHLPLHTNPRAFWWDEDSGFLHMEEGVWHGPVPIHRDHTILNLGSTTRIHLTVDLELK